MKSSIKAIWRTPDSDIPVVIVGSYGVLNGEEWLILESGTGVRKSEIVFEKTRWEKFKKWLTKSWSGVTWNMNFKIHIKAGTVKKRLRYAPKQKTEKNKKKYDRKRLDKRHDVD